MTRREIWLTVAKQITPHYEYGICTVLYNMYIGGSINRQASQREKWLIHKMLDLEKGRDYPYLYPRTPEGNAQRRALCRRLAKKFTRTTTAQKKGHTRRGKK